MSQSDQFDNYNNGSDDEVPESGVNDMYGSAMDGNESTEFGTDGNESIESGADGNESTELGADDNEVVESGTDVSGTAESGIDENVVTAIETGGMAEYAGNDSVEATQNDGFYPYDDRQAQNENPYNGQYNSNGQYNTSAAGGNEYYNGQPTQNGNPYNNPYNNNPYNNNNFYNNNSYNGSNPYGGNSYNGQPAQNNNPYGSNPYNNGSYSGQTTQNNNPYGNNPYSGSPYSGQAAQNNQQNRNGNPPYGNNQYSPYAAPAKKNNTGLIIGIVVGIMVLFLIIVFAIAYMLVTYTTERITKRNNREEYNFDFDDDDRGSDRNGNDYYNDDYFDDYFYDDGHQYDHDHYYDYDDDDFYDGYDFDNDGGYNDDADDDRYYSLHNEIRNDLPYSVEMEEYEYETTYENVDIRVIYPIVKGKDIPNLDKINSTIKDEVDFITEYFEDEYQDYMSDDSDYFTGVSTGYVAYMDEDKLSIVFDENISSRYFSDVFLYSLNIDMENGIILDNESLLSIDDDFSVDFRKRSKIQNSEASTDYLAMMTDQEITKHFKSSDIIVFYTPMGMEIGFNFDQGWVTVTYQDYEKYLKVF